MPTNPIHNDVAVYAMMDAVRGALKALDGKAHVSVVMDDLIVTCNYTAARYLRGIFKRVTNYDRGLNTVKLRIPISNTERGHRGPVKH
jgi:hypothetical protein